MFRQRYLNPPHKEKNEYLIFLNGIVKNLAAPKQRKLKLDNNARVISREESEWRIIKLLIFLSILLCVGITQQLTQAIYDKYFIVDDKTIVVYPKLPVAQKMTNPMSRSHVTLIDAKGNLIDLSVNIATKTAELAWRMKLPNSPKYFAFTRDRKVFVVYGTRSMDMTYIKSNKYHRQLTGSNPIYQYDTIYGMSTVVDKKLWILGSKRAFLHSISSQCK